MKRIKVLVVGLGRLSKRFCENFASNPTGQFDIVGVSDFGFDEGHQSHASMKDELGMYDIPYYGKLEDAIRTLGEKVDVILDTTADHSWQHVADELLKKTHNHHTVTANLEDYLSQRV